MCWTMNEFAAATVISNVINHGVYSVHSEKNCIIQNNSEYDSNSLAQNEEFVFIYSIRLPKLSFHIFYKQ